MNVAKRITESLGFQALSIKPCASFTFDELPTSGSIPPPDPEVTANSNTDDRITVEHQIIVEVDASPDDPSSPSGSESVQTNGHWFPCDELPYSQMPRDDEVWYPMVLLHGAVGLVGHFAFEGELLREYSIGVGSFSSE
jgi:hypothetical protein